MDRYKLCVRLQYGAIYGKKLCSPWTENVCVSGVYDEEYCYKYDCGEIIPKKLLKLIETDYPGTFEKKKNIIKFEMDGNDTRNGSATTAFAVCIQSYLLPPIDWFNRYFSNFEIVKGSCVKK